MNIRDKLIEVVEYCKNHFANSKYAIDEWYFLTSIECVFEEFNFIPKDREEFYQWRAKAIEDYYGKAKNAECVTLIDISSELNKYKSEVNDYLEIIISLMENYYNHCKIIKNVSKEVTGISFIYNKYKYKIIEAKTISKEKIQDVEGSINSWIKEISQTDQNIDISIHNKRIFDNLIDFSKNFPNSMDKIENQKVTVRNHLKSEEKIGIDVIMKLKDCIKGKLEEIMLIEERAIEMDLKEEVDRINEIIDQEEQDVELSYELGQFLFPVMTYRSNGDYYIENYEMYGGREGYQRYERNERYKRYERNETCFSETQREKSYFGRPKLFELNIVYKPRHSSKMNEHFGTIYEYFSKGLDFSSCYILLSDRSYPLFEIKVRPVHDHELHEIASVWLLMKNLSTKKNILTDRGIFVWITDYIYLEVYLREPVKNIKPFIGFFNNEDDKIENPPEHILNGYSDTSLSLPIGLYIVSEGFIMEMYFHQSVLLKNENTDNFLIEKARKAKKREIDKEND